MTIANWSLVVVILVAVGCGGGGDKTDAHIRLVVADKNIRREGVECAGAIPFQHIHKGASFQVESADGDVVAEGELPAGRSRNAEPEIDWGVKRIPTFCVVDFDVELPKRPRYRLRLGSGRPLEFRPPARADDRVELVVG